MTTPGRRTPGSRTPGASTPGRESPGGVDRESLSASGVAIDGTGTTTVGTLNADRAEAYLVRVDADSADFNFNVNVDGTAAFSAAQSPSGTSEELFTPDEEARFVLAAPGADVVFEVTSTNAPGGATATVTVAAITDAEA